MAGYSGTPLVKKLGIKPGTRAQFLGVPPGFDLKPLAAEAKVVRSGELDFAQLFVRSTAQLKKNLGPLFSRMAPETGTMVWVCWPKKSSGVTTDVTEDVVREAALPLGWVDVKVCAVNETWSGLKFYRRKAQVKAAGRN